MKVQRHDLEIRPLDGNGHRCAVVVDGIVRFVGSAEECCVRAELLKPRASDRDRQDRMLRRAVR
jgi:hypothetical protein